MAQELPFASESSISNSHCAATNSDSDDFESVEQERKRLQRGRAYAKVARKKAKSKQQLLERQLADLTEEVGRLKAVAATATPSFTDSSYNQKHSLVLQKLAVAYNDPLTTDQEFIAIFDEIQESFGINAQKRMAAISNTFRQSMDLMIPMPVKFGLGITELASSEKLLSEWEAFVTSAHLTPEQIAVLQGTGYEQEKAEIIKFYSSLKKPMDKILRRAKTLNSLLTVLRSILKPRQAAAFGLWLNKYYACLDADRTLNYGCNSTDLLAEPN